MHEFRRIVTIAVLLACAGCARTVYLPRPPPAPRVEAVPPAPAAGQTWISGHWKWSGRRYEWVPGRWTERPAGEWVSGRWIKKSRGWFWLPGHWR